MSINVKKYTKDQMAKMVEEAQEAAEKMNGCMNELRSRNSELELQVRTLKAKNAALTEQIDQMNGEAINKANEIANRKAYADALRNKLADTEAALGRANACIATMQVEKDQQTKELFEWWSSAQALHDDLLDVRDRANYAESHPWRNLWAWLKRKLVSHE